MKKKTLMLFLVLIVLAAIIGYVALLKNNNSSQTSTNIYSPLTEELRTKILSYSNKKQLSNNIAAMLNQLNDPSVSDEKKYEILTKLGFYFSAEYSKSHDPSIRTFVSEKMGSFAKLNLQKYYKTYDFDLPCADPTCGNKIDNNAQEIIDLISANEKIDKDYKRVILINLKTALYVPDSSLEDKQSGISLAISQLEKQNNKEASEAAVLLKNYFYDKYNVNL